MATPQILNSGQVNTKVLRDADRQEDSYRRAIHEIFPNGTYNIACATNMIQDEPVNSVKFYWADKVYGFAYTLTTNNNGSVGPFADTSNVALASNATISQGDKIRIAVVDAEKFSPGNRVTISDIDRDNKSSTVSLEARVINRFPTTTPQRIEIEALHTITLIDNDTTDENIDKYVWVSGHNSAEGVTANEVAVNNLEVENFNYTEIHRTPKWISGSAMNQRHKYHLDGLPMDMKREALIHHLSGIDYNFLTSNVRNQTTAADRNDRPIRYNGGLPFWLSNYEAADSDYRGGTGAPAITSDDSEDKRIINNLAGTLSYKDLLKYTERTARYGSPLSSGNKIAFCGSGARLVLDELFRKNTVITEKLPISKEFSIRWTYVDLGTARWELMTHPLMTQNPVLRNQIIIIDNNCIKFRYLQNRDTDLYPEYIDKVHDFFAWSWVTEYGWEVSNPMAHMIIKNVTQAV